MTESATDTTLCTGTCNTRPGSVVVAKIAPDLLYFLNPATGEILECSAENAAAVRHEIAFLNTLVDDLLTAQFATTQATQALYEAQTRVDPHAQQAAARALDRSLAQEAKARDVMFKEFKDLPQFNDGAGGLLELLPLATHRGQKLVRTRRMTYVRSAKVKGHLRTYANLPGDAGKLKSFYAKDADGHYKLDRKKLADALSTVKPKAALAKADVTWWATGWAPDFVEGFNSRNAPADDAEKKKKQYDALHEDACLQFSGGAVLLRFFAGAGGEAKVDVSSKSFKEMLKGHGEVSAKLTGSARAGVDLASARIDAALYLPAKRGLHLHVAAGRNATGGQQELELGYPLSLHLVPSSSPSCPRVAELLAGANWGGHFVSRGARKR